MTGLTSNPTIFDHAIKNSPAYDAAIRRKVKEGKSGEELFFDLALEDLTQAADLFRPDLGPDERRGRLGVARSLAPAGLRHGQHHRRRQESARAGERPNLFIKIPGTKEGLPAIEEAIFAGVPINVTLLFSREQYVAAAEAYLRGIERRIAAGLKPDVGSVASVFISRWDAAVAGKVPAALTNTARHRHRQANLQGVPRSARLAALAAHLQRRRPSATPAVGQHGNQGPQGVRHPVHQGARRAVHGQHHARGHVESPRRSRRDRRDMPADGGDCEEVLAQFAKAGVDIDALAAQLQDEGAKSFVKSWNELMGVISSKSAALRRRAT